MPILEGDIGLIERHIQGNLNDEDQILFSQRMQDADFKMEISLYSEMKNSATDIGRATIRQQFAAWDREALSEKSSSRIPRQWWKIAAGFLILVGISVFAFLMSSKLNPEELYLASHGKFPNLVDPIVKGISTDELTISILYESSDYGQAISMTATDSLQQFYQGLSHLELGNTKKAIDFLLPVVANPKHRFHQEGQWYLALGYLREQEFKPCQDLLTVISTNNLHDFQQNASILLTDLAKAALISD